MATLQSTMPTTLRGRLRLFAMDRPLVFALLLTLASMAVGLSGGLVIRNRAWLETYPLSVNDLLQALLAVALLTGLGWWRAAGFTRPAHWRALAVLWLPALMALVPLAGLAANGTPVTGAVTIAVIAFTTFLVGFHEEALFRGLILRALLPGGVPRAVLLSALLFGLAHLAGLALGRHPLLVLVQVAFTFGAGVCYAAVRLRTGTIWPLVIIHWLFDLFGWLASPQGTLLIREAPPVALLAYLGVLGLVYAGYGLFLLRRDWFPGTRTARITSQPAA